MIFLKLVNLTIYKQFSFINISIDSYENKYG